jgi:hypothetical protein
LGVLARDGTGGKVDLELAYFHCQVARLQGGESAKSRLETDR